MAPDPISPQTARRSTWHDERCTVYHLVDRADLSVVQENIAPGAVGEEHAHDRSRQFFHVLTGQATVLLGAREVLVAQGCGLEVPARARHQVRNDGDDELVLIVVSAPRVPGRSRPARQQPLARDRGGLLVGSLVRPTRRTDVPTVVAFEEAVDTRGFLGQGGTQWHLQVIGDPDMEHLVLVDRLDRVVAFGILAGLDRPERIEIRRMVVAPEGRGQGLGRLLLRRLLERALDSPEVHRVWLDVSCDNTRALSLYRAFGFVEKPAPPDAVLLDNGVYLEWSAEQP